MMMDRQPISDSLLDEVLELTLASLGGKITPEAISRLDELVRNSDVAREIYARTIRDSFCLRRWADAMAESRSPEFSDVPSCEPLDADEPPRINLFSDGVDGAAGHLLSGWTTAYLVATLVLGLGILVGVAVHVSGPGEFAVTPSRATPSTPDPVHEGVARITDMVDCQWAGGARTALMGGRIPLGRQFTLLSGLLEITYDTGAKVVLQGPATYEISGNDSGYLSAGKLTASVEKRGEAMASGRQPAVDGSKLDDKRRSASPQSLIPNPSLPIAGSPLFTVTTPTATVTDLGTEFGVEVSKDGNVTTHVFRGTVKVEALGGDANDPRNVRVLHENESARVELGVDRRPTVGPAPAGSDRFVRRLPRRIPIEVFSTGAQLKEGDRDPHWQIVALSTDPTFQPRPAQVTQDSSWGPNDSTRAQWISVEGGNSYAAGGIFTFRTEFTLKDGRPEGAVLRGWFMADDYLAALRLNGREVRFSRDAARADFEVYRPLTIADGFVSGVNILEADVCNWGGDGADPGTPMGLYLELHGDALEETDGTLGGK